MKHMLIAILLLMATPTTADADPLDWRCTTGDFSTTVPPYTTHWRVAYWLHEDLVLGQFRFSSAGTVSCSVLDVSRPVTTLTPVALAEQPPARPRPASGPTRMSWGRSSPGTG